MGETEKGAYILGTERAELHRLGFQHQVWASEARQGWDYAQFGMGQTILDFGCGPGFCTRDLAYVVGPEGKVIGLDKSEAYIDFLNKTAELHGLDIQTICSDFDNALLPENSLDGIYDRWALAWIKNPQEIIEKLTRSLKPGGIIVAQEYYDWSTFQTEPRMPGLSKGIAAALKSWEGMEGHINIGRELPSMFFNAGLEVIRTRPMAKITTAEDLTWHWPKSFFEIYLPKLVDMGYISSDEVEEALTDFTELEFIEGATLFCPTMTEVVAVKP